MINNDNFKVILLMVEKKKNTQTILQLELDSTLKKKVLLRRAKIAAKAEKTATKGPFDLQWCVLLRWFYLLLLGCYNRFIVAITKSATVDAPFRGAFSLLQWAENRCHMRLEFESIDLQRWAISAAIGPNVRQNICTFQWRL